MDPRARAWRWLAVVAAICALVLTAAAPASAVEGHDEIRTTSGHVDLGVRPREAAKRPVADDERGTSRARPGPRGAFAPALVDVFPDVPQRVLAEPPARSTTSRAEVAPLGCNVRGALPEPRAPPAASAPHT